jgi:hypothetical protein
MLGRLSSTHSGPLPGAAAIAVVVTLLLLPAVAEGFKAKTNRGGVCTVKPQTAVQGDQVTYGVRVQGCRTRNGVRRVASQGLAIEGHQIVSALARKEAPPPYLNRRTSNRLLPDPTRDLPIEVPDLPLLPPLPDLPIDIPPLPELPELPLPDLPGGNKPGATYTRLDYSLLLGPNKGRRAKRKPERWRPRDGCVVTTTKRSNDTLVCQSFAPTG